VTQQRLLQSFDLGLQGIKAKPQNPRVLLVVLSALDSAGAEPTNILKKNFKFQHLSGPLSYLLRYNTVPVYGSIRNENFFNQIMACPGSAGGGNDMLFRAATLRRQR
jgi:hypothetical protein